MAPKKAAAASSAKAKDASHPAYLDMIKEAIITLKERNGSSRQEVKKYILANYKLESVPEATFKLQVNRALTKGVSSGALTQPKGPSGPVKLAKTDSKPAAKATKTEKETKPAVKKESKPAVKKAPAKKAAAPAKKASTTKKAAAPAKKAAAAPKKAAAAAKPKAKANTAKPRKTASADAVEKKEVTLGKTKSGRVTKSSAPPKKAAASKKAAATKKAAAPKKAAKKA